MIESGFSVLYFVPLFLIIILANLADKQRLDGSSGKAAVRLSYGIHIVFFGAIALFGVLLHVLGFRMWTDDDLTQRILNMLAGDQAEQLEVFLPILVGLSLSWLESRNSRSAKLVSQIIAEEVSMDAIDGFVEQGSVDLQ